MNAHPWQSGPRELFEFAIHVHTPSDDARRRISFLLIDVCVETTLRTFLRLPARISGSKVGYPEQRRYTAGKFHELTTGAQLATGGRISNDLVCHLRFYHDTRNHLYHEGNGITVPEEHVRGYGALAARLLKELLGIDGEAMLPVAWKQGNARESRGFDDMRRDLDKEIDRFERAVYLVMERSEPRMVYPSTIRKLRECSEFDITTFGARLLSFRELIKENISHQKLRAWLLEFLADDVTYGRPQVISNSQLIMELGENAVAFFAFLVGIQSLPLEDVSMETLDNWDDISFVRQDDYSIMGVYVSARFFAGMLAEKRWFGMSETELLDRCRELQSKLKAITLKVEGLIPA